MIARLRDGLTRLVESDEGQATLLSGSGLVSSEGLDLRLTPLRTEITKAGADLAAVEKRLKALEDWHSRLGRVAVTTVATISAVLGLVLVALEVAGRLG